MGGPLDGISNQPWVAAIQRSRWSCAAPESIDWAARSNLWASCGTTPSSTCRPSAAVLS